MHWLIQVKSASQSNDMPHDKFARDRELKDSALYIPQHSVVSLASWDETAVTGKGERRGAVVLPLARSACRTNWKKASSVSRLFLLVEWGPKLTSKPNTQEFTWTGPAIDGTWM